jgi:L-amino acid N-acyltransferase YncA
MKENVTIRDAVLADLPRIVEIYNSTIPGRMVTADTEPVSVESREKWFYEHSPNFRPLWIMDYQGQVCGWLSFQSFYGRPAYNATAEISIYIDHTFRGKGLGSYFLEKALEACPKLKIKTLLGFIFGHNQPSLKLFYGYGFEKWGYLPRIAEFDGIERDLIIVGKRIIE